VHKYSAGLLDFVMVVKTLIVREFLVKKGIITLDHPPYSPDLAPCDFWLFPKLKLAMKGKTYSTIPTIQKASTDILKAIPYVHYIYVYIIYMYIYMYIIYMCTYI